MAFASTYQPGYVVRCNACLNTFRVECLGHSLAGLPVHCPYCSSKDINRTINNDEDNWYALAEGFGFPYNATGALIVKELFEIWDREEYSKFRDFVEAFKKENDDDN